MSHREILLAELCRALELVLTASEVGHAQAAVPLLDAAIVASCTSADAEVLQLCLAATMAREALAEQRVGPARRFAGAALRDVRRHRGTLS